MPRLAVCALPSRAWTVWGPEGAGWKRSPCCVFTQSPGAEPKAVNASWRAGGPRPRVQTPGGGELSNSALRYDPHPSTAKRPKVPQELRTPRRARNYAPELQTPVTSVTFERNVAGTMWRPQLCSKGVY